MTVAVPWLGPAVTESVVRVWVDSLAGPGESLARTFTLVEPSSATVARSAWATGGSFTSVTVTETVAVSQLESGEPLGVPSSHTLSVKLSEQLKSALGV